MNGLHHIHETERPAKAGKEGLPPCEVNACSGPVPAVGVQLLPSGEASCPELWEQAQGLFEKARRLQGMEHHNALLESASKFCEVVLATGFFPEEKSYALNNLGLIFQALASQPSREESEATRYLMKSSECFAQAVTLNPENATILQNFATVRMCLSDLYGADKYLQKALERDPKCPEARWNAALIALAFGDYRRGFLNFEWRWRCGQFTWRKLKTCRPQWNGQDLKGKTILLTHEQGFGDSIMMVRYAKLVKARGAKRVRYLCLPELMGIMKGVEGIDEINEFKDINLDGTAGDEDFDYHCPMFSLARVFKTRVDTVPWDGAYICSHLKQARWQREERRFLKVGLVWAGRKEHGNDKNRSMRLADMAPLFDVPGISWYSLQFGPRANDVVDYSQIYAPWLKSFEDTAWWLNELDLLISVDTAVVHLAGAMNRPVWNLLATSSDWRWMLDREDTPWYPSMRLFRQKVKGDWAEVIERVRKELNGLYTTR